MAVDLGVSRLTATMAPEGCTKKPDQPGLPASMMSFSPKTLTAFIVDCCDWTTNVNGFDDADG